MLVKIPPIRQFVYSINYWRNKLKYENIKVFELCACIRFGVLVFFVIKCIHFLELIESLMAFKDINCPLFVIMEHYQSQGREGRPIQPYDKIAVQQAGCLSI